MSLISNGVILKLTPYKERAIIVLLFTEQLGLVSTMLSPSKKNPTHWVEPFVTVRVKFKEKKGDFFYTQEIDGTRWFLGLREKPAAIRALKSATDILIKCLEKEIPAPLLYRLLLKVIELLETGMDAATMEGLFLVKLALHEGILKISDPWVEKVATARAVGSIPKIPPHLLDRLRLL